jgi:hypothetical protein
MHYAKSYLPSVPIKDKVTLRPNSVLKLLDPVRKSIAKKVLVLEEPGINEHLNEGAEV